MEISYEGMSAKEAVALVSAACSAKNGGTQPTSDNSDYAAALRTYKEYRELVPGPLDLQAFIRYLVERLNASTHCA